MKKIRKILIIIVSITFALLLTSVTSLILILEPNVKISGFAEMNEKLLIQADNNILLDSQGDVITDNFMIKGTHYCNYEDIPPTLLNAFIAVEDKRFYSHKGVDYVRILGALVNNLKQGRIAEGGSTITQQLVKNTHLSQSKTIKRKIQEIRIAREIERKFTKEQILEMYLNMLYFGNNIYGIGAAANFYFNCDVESLNLNQCAALAAMINNPSLYNPFTHLDHLTERKNTVLKRMKNLNYISEEEYLQALNTELIFATEKQVTNHFYGFAYKEAMEICGYTDSAFADSEYQIETTLNSEYQSAIESILEKSIPDENTLAQAVIIENKTGNVLAYAGSRRVNFTEVYRQLGSTIKPILCYAPCLEKKLISPCTPILDEPTEFENNYKPKNYHDIYKGWISCQEALISSSNVCAIKLLEMAGIYDAIDFARSSGLKISYDDASLGLALGATHKGNRLIEIANAYQMLGNGGGFLPCSFIKEIRDKKGRCIYKERATDTQVMDKGNAYLINSMLTECVKKGTAKKLNGCEYAVAAKTGTVGNKDGNTDAYCITYGQDYTLAVWFGAKENLMPNEISGGTLPTVTAKNILNELKLDLKAFSKPDNVAEMDIDLVEYETNHKVLISNGFIPRRQVIKCLFNRNNIPRGRSKRFFPKFILNMKKLDFENLHIS